MDLYPNLATHVLNTFAETFSVRNQHVDVVVATFGLDSVPLCLRLYMPVSHFWAQVSNCTLIEPY